MTEYTFETPQPIKLDIKNLAGDVTVRALAVDQTRVALTGRHADEATVAETADGVTIRSPLCEKADVFPLHNTLRRHRIDVDVDVPLGSEVVLVLGAGDTAITGELGRLDLRPGAGRVSVGQAAGDLSVHLGAGSITVDTIGAAAKVVSGAGSVNIGHVSGRADIQVGTGEISIESVSGSSRVKTGAGSVRAKEVTGDLQAESGIGGAVVERISAGSFTFKGTGGGVKIGVAEGVPVWTDLASVMGSVRNSLPSVGEPLPGQDHVELKVNIVSGGIELKPA